MSGSNREMTPLTPREWERAGEHYRAAFDAIVRLGNTLLAMKAPAKAKACSLRLREVARDRLLDMGPDLVHDAERQGYGELAYSAIVGRDEDRVSLYLTHRKLVMDRHRWIELGDEMLSCLERTEEPDPAGGPVAHPGPGRSPCPAAPAT